MTEGTRGLVIIFTGEGKGKTSAALGSAMRTVGHGRRCKIYQFIKAAKKTGELHLVSRLAPELEITQVGLGFTRSTKFTQEEHRNAAQAGLAEATETIQSGIYTTVILDEILYAIKSGLVSTEQVLDVIAAKPAHVHLILTGRGAPAELLEKADMVTEMVEIAHPYKKGIPAQKGIDY